VLGASIWHPPAISEEARDARARRQAQAAILLLQLGQPDRVWPRLRHAPGDRVRSFLLDRLELPGTDREALWRRLGQESDVSARRALILGLGGLPAGRRRAAAARLLADYRDDPDPGIHSAANWALRRWGYDQEVRAIDRELASGGPRGQRRWYVNRRGHTLAVLLDPGFSWGGCPANEPGEPLERRRIGRSYAIATREVTIGQFLEYLKGRPVPQWLWERNRDRDPNRPVVKVTWFDAARYCRWLSEREGVAEDQMCYPRIEEIRSGMTLPADYLSRTGYRLPTSAEWEHACRAGAWTSRPHGHAEELLGRYAAHASNQARPVGALWPNDLGLFDMLGNAAEWTNDLRYRLGPEALRTHRVGSGPGTVTDLDLLITRGGSYLDGPAALRSAAVSTMLACAPVAGLRVVRTIRSGR
jgi:formylglycine-generating enzyme required for sulfatase activity